MTSSKDSIQWGALIAKAAHGGPHVELIDYAASPFVKSNAGVVISGFWRSGTTWVQQMVADLTGAKSVFEPFDPRISRYRQLTLRQHIEPQVRRSLHTYMPFQDREYFTDKELGAYLADALRARLRGMWVRRARRLSTEAFRTRVITKFVRGQLCLTAIAGTFGVPIVHVYRDPRAVVASVNRAGWGKGWLFDVDLSLTLLDLDDGRREYFKRWEDVIRKSRSLGAVERIATFWALTERFIVDESSPKISRLTLVNYEDLSAEPHRHLSERLEGIGVSVKTKDEAAAVRSAERSSPTSGYKRARAVMTTKMKSWKMELTSSEISSVERISAGFDLADRLVD